ncbi:hypothetical protein [Mucilaginibacter kameinonensis]|uniref:hypothetical protein n=1 Tax=Mucilaginibacter kameinonensis TaxID=452286 RepID=UPI000EF7C2FA|nr:hypothetical protein [Mucilaginibacter kameinonensis]
MKTNFFETFAGLQFKGNLQINMILNENDSLLVSVLPAPGNPQVSTGKNLPPLLFKGSPGELDEVFFQKLTGPLKQTGDLFANAEAYQQALAKAQKDSKGGKDKAGKTKSENEGEAEEAAEDLFSPKADDKQAKAEKKKLFDEAMDKVRELKQTFKYDEAIAALPDAGEHPEQVEEINTKAAELRKQKAIYASLQD